MVSYLFGPDTLEFFLNINHPRTTQYLKANIWQKYNIRQYVDNNHQKRFFSEWTMRGIIYLTWYLKLRKKNFRCCIYTAASFTYWYRWWRVGPWKVSLACLACCSSHFLQRLVTEPSPGRLHASLISLPPNITRARVSPMVSLVADL